MCGRFCVKKDTKLDDFVAKQYLTRYVTIQNSVEVF